ncbi:MAG: hypothetical protein K8H84_13970 [Sulfuricella denitrificans]|nr:hypothetical protein [Sulfuricella denitrificans]
MARTLSKTKGRSDNGPSFTKLVHAYFQSAEYAELSTRAVKLLIDLYSQFRGDNNGDLCATFSVMKKCGWNSNDQLQKALVELLATGWIIMSRRGGRKQPHLYALTTMGIDKSPKLDSHVRPNPGPLNLWKRENRHHIVMDETTAARWAKISAQK